MAWVLVQGVFGKYTVTLKLYPAIVTAHWLGALLLLALLAHGWVVFGVWMFIHPEPALWGLLSLPVALLAGMGLFKRAAQPERLTVPIVLTIVAAVLHGLALSAGLLFLQLG